ncbi:MAG: aldehyde dehydrogenase family protein, partial [Bryobacteraceae bacterium]
MTKLFINGRAEDSAGNVTIPVVNPATGEMIATVPDATAEDVDRAVAAARASFENKAWRGKDSSEKERIMWRFADILEAHKQELAALESSENGKTLKEALRADVAPAIDALRYYAGWVRRIYG